MIYSLFRSILIVLLAVGSSTIAAGPVIEQMEGGVLRITAQTQLYAHNLSGDYVFPPGTLGVSEAMPAGNRLWYGVLMSPPMTRPLIKRNNSGSVNDELMWRPDGSFWYVDGDMLRSSNVLTPPIMLPTMGMQWRSGSASCTSVQFVKGETPLDTYIQPFNSVDGKLWEGFYLAVASGGRARKARNIVRYDHWRHGPGFLVSSQSDASHEHYFTLKGERWEQFEPDDSNGAARWSHAATWGETFVACRPFTGTIEQYGKDGIKELVSQPELQELTGAERFPQWFHGSTNGSVAVFSVLEGEVYLGMYAVELSTRERWLIRTPDNPEIVNSDFASMARPAITLDGKHAVWHERPGVVYVAPIRQTTVPEPDELAELTQRVKRLERIINDIHAATK